ncbi:MAG: nucleotidyltransferase domain-containing protein [Catalinimonas sp.]
MTYLTREQIISKLRANKASLREKFDVRAVGLFGSYSTGAHTDGSDIDIVYELMEGRRLGLREIEALEAHFGELFHKRAVDLVDRRYVNPIVWSEIEKTAIYV